MGLSTQEALRNTWSLKLNDSILYLGVMSWIGVSKAEEESLIIEFVSDRKTQHNIEVVRKGETD